MIQESNIENHKFDDFKKAKQFVIDQGFSYWSGKPIVLGEGFEHIFMYEYQHKHDINKVCRMVDLQNVQLKPKDSDNMPVLLDFFQVSIKINN
jgi:hypothetical protein